MKNKLITNFLICLLLIFNACQGLTDFIPQDFEEKLCVTAVIESGGELNKIFIERTFQSEYPADESTHLEELSVVIRSDSEIVFEYFNPKSDNRIDTVILPAGIDFLPDQKYTLIISEKNSELITSEVNVPSSPQIPEVSIEGMAQTFLPPPAECHNPVKAMILNVDFITAEDCNYYLGITGNLDPWLENLQLNFADYEIIESNSPYFKTFLYGFRSIGFPYCGFTPVTNIPSSNYQPCFFDSKTIPETTSKIKIKININPYFDYTKPIRITLNSIPKELYDYEKSYHTYIETLSDPFSEPVYLRGNINGGYGIFAICNGSYTSLLLPE